MKVTQPGQVKYAVMENIIHFIYRQVEERRWKQLNSLIERNDIASCMTRLVFQYKGKRYHQVVFSRPPQGVPPLVESLMPEMDAYIAEQDQIELKEKPMIRAYLRGILNSSKELHTVLVRLPTAVHTPIAQAVATAEEALGVKAELNFEQVAELVGAHPGAVEAIRNRMMLNMLME